MRIQILVSTMDFRVCDIEFNPKYDYVVVHQIKKIDDIQTFNRYISEKMKYINIIYYQMFELGLSKSRNKALELSTAKYVWIMDDDTKILDNAYENICTYFYKSDVDFISVRHFMGSRLVNKRTVKTKVNFINAANISSIDMVLSQKCINSEIKFDERFGLGSSLPSGEEYIFITDLIKKGFKGEFTDIEGAIHLDETSSGNDFFSNEKLILAKLEMFKRIFPRTYWFWIILFIFKKINSFIYNFSSLRSALNAFKI